jgi:hypothetical protein
LPRFYLRGIGRFAQWSQRTRTLPSLNIDFHDTLNRNIVERERPHELNGVFAANAALRAAITPGGRGIGAQKRTPAPEQRVSNDVRMNWARRLKRVFGIEIEQCVRCGGRLKVREHRGAGGHRTHSCAPVGVGRGGGADGRRLRRERRRSGCCSDSDRRRARVLERAVGDVASDVTGGRHRLRVRAETRSRRESEAGWPSRSAVSFDTWPLRAGATGAEGWFKIPIRARRHARQTHEPRHHPSRSHPRPRSARKTAKPVTKATCIHDAIAWPSGRPANKYWVQAVAST